ncbi:MAG TPA: hypothetical protein VGA56_22200, partial [Opitutaceae bacterium]
MTWGVVLPGEGGTGFPGPDTDRDSGGPVSARAVSVESAVGGLQDKAVMMSDGSGRSSPHE